jgi:hypothetical protein
VTTVDDVRRAIADAVADEPAVVLVASDMEPHLLRILELVRAAAPHSRSELAELFAAAIRGQLRAPDWMVSFCMVDLRWPEVLEAAKAERDHGNPRNFSQAWEVIDVYEGRWAGYDLFATFQDPSEPDV